MKRIYNIVRRELYLWSRRPIYLIGSVGVMLASALFFLTFFGKGMPEDIPIGVVDRDRSSTSRNFVRQLDATQQLLFYMLYTTAAVLSLMESQGRFS